MKSYIYLPFSILFLLLNVSKASVAENTYFNRINPSIFSVFGPRGNRIERYISKINNDNLINIDIGKIDPWCSNLKPYKERKGVEYARRIEKIINPEFDIYNTITKNGVYYCLTSEDLLIIQELYKQWWIKFKVNKKSNTIKHIDALEGSDYKWQRRASVRID